MNKLKHWYYRRQGYHYDDGMYFQSRTACCNAKYTTVVRNKNGKPVNKEEIAAILKGNQDKDHLTYRQKCDRCESYPAKINTKIVFMR